MPAFLPYLLLLAAGIVPTIPGVRYEQPQLASDGRQAVIVFGAGSTIYFAHPDGSPVTVAEVPVMPLGRHRGPRIALTSGAIVITTGVAPAGQRFGLNTIRSWRSTDGGKTWQPGPDVTPPGAAGSGLHALASDGKQRLVSAWLGPKDGAPRLFTAHSDDAGLTWSKPAMLSATVCDCCHPSAAISADGTVHIMFRNALDGKRDLYLATAPDGEHFTIAKLGAGTWPLDACPMDGGSLAEFNGDVVTLWRREGDLFLASPGEPKEEHLALGKNPAVALREAGYYAVWSGREGIMARVPGKAPYVLSKEGGFPVLTERGPVIAAWEEDGKIRTASLDSPNKTR